MRANLPAGVKMTDVREDAVSIALDLIKKWEGCKLTAYKCSAGVWTIGWGSTGPGITHGVKWTQEQADKRLHDDVQRFASGVFSAVTYDATPAQLGAMISLAYNIGLGAFRSSTLLRLFNAGDTSGAHAQFPRWNKAGGKVVNGLTNRRRDEAAVFAGAKK